MRREKDRPWFDRHFPNERARFAADRAIEALDVHEPMAAFIDAWLAAYKAAGGKTRVTP